MYPNNIFLVTSFCKTYQSVNRKIATASIFLSLFFIVSFGGIAQEKGIIKGKITSQKGNKPIAGATISLIQSEKVVKSTFSTTGGNYTLDNIVPGTYKITVSAEGYVPVKISSFKIETKKTYLQNFILESIAKDAIATDAIIEYKAPPKSMSAVGAGEATSMYSRGADDSKKTKGVKSSASFEMDFFEVETSGLLPNPKRNATDLPAYVPIGRAGALTAGEVNDFSKWTLWKDIAENTLNAYQKQWGFIPMQRYSLQLTNEAMNPVVDASVKLISNKKQVIWQAKTDNTGKAELWDGFFGEKLQESLQMIITYKGNEYKIDKVKKFQDGINLLKIPVACEIPNAVDIMFVVDATGSMSDELEYLKEEVKDIMEKVKKQHAEMNLRLGSVFYRDFGDEYVVRKFDFTESVEKAHDFINNQRAAAGGDYPEAVDTAMEVAITNIQWRTEARTRILFLVLDAPPHENPKVIAKLQQLIKEAAAQGIRIVPVSGSGIDKSTEYLMRTFALATNGTYSFITNHSGIGDRHIEPTTDKYDVELLNDLLIRIINQYVFVPQCNHQFVKDTSDIKDTTLVTMPDTLSIAKEDSSKITITTDSTTITKPLPLVAWKYYPNPTSGLLYIDVTSHIGELFLTDLSGKILERIIVNEPTIITMDLSIYPTGTYFLRYAYKADKWLSGKVLLVR